jgi:hypothetical protein
LKQSQIADEIYKWFLAALLYGARIMENVATPNMARIRTHWCEKACACAAVHGVDVKKLWDADQNRLTLIEEVCPMMCQ